jgi:probable phosphoglycerate mutase
MSTILYLVRHGETVDNASQTMQGQTQGALNERGILQARALSEEWRDREIDVVVASDLKRAIDTAAIIAAPHGLEVVTTPLLRERDWGDFTGRYIPDLKNEPWPDNVESLENLLSRAGEFITYVRQTFPGKKVLAVGHGIINKAIQAVLYQKSMSEILKMSNAEVRELAL